MCNTSFDSQFQAIPFYQSHPYMKPFVGDEYESSKHKKLLLIGESHYMPAGSTVHHDVDSWYDGKPILTRPERNNCHTRKTRIWKSARFGSVVESYLKLVMPFNGNGWHQVAFLNYFLRPADENKGIKELWITYGGENVDREKAIWNFIKVLEILKPDLFIFMSKNVCKCVDWFGEKDEDQGDYKKYFGGFLWERSNLQGVKYVYTNHPSSPHWNMDMPIDYVKPRINASINDQGMKSCNFFVTWLKENWLK